MPQLLVARPPDRPLPQDVFVIKLRRTYYGLHDEGDDGVSRAGILAFAHQNLAARRSDLLWRHRMAQGSYPSRVLRRGESVEMDDRGLMVVSRNELRVDRVPLRWLQEVMGRSGGAVNLVREERESETGAHHVHTNSGVRLSWEECDATCRLRREYLDDLFRKRTDTES